MEGLLRGGPVWYVRSVLSPPRNLCHGPLKDGRMSQTLPRTLWRQWAKRSLASNRRRLFLEWLEERAVPAVFTVTNNADSGLGSFRQALLDSNGTEGTATINFLMCCVQDDLSIFQKEVDAWKQSGVSSTSARASGSRRGCRCTRPATPGRPRGSGPR